MTERSAPEPDDSRVVTPAQKLRNRIPDRYVSLRQFTLACGVPYSTLTTLLARGPGGASFELVIRLCRELELDPLELLSER